jgi:protein tyrosine phosphatase (PTP) superfamily phosphohydrolase (DUF442 family)
MVRTILLSAVAGAALVAAGGCRHRCCSTSTAAPRPYLPLPPSVTPDGRIPPPGVPITPGAQALPPADLGPPMAAPGSNSNRPAPEILLPDPIPSGQSSRVGSSPVLGGPVRPAGGTAEPPVAAPPNPTAGLPGFTRVKEGVASGRKPALEGFDTLKRTGFKSVVYLHAAGADISAVRVVAEKKGLTFAAVEATPEKLSDAVTAFDRVVADRAAQPVYVFDDDGLRTGALWYVHFRTTDQLSPEVARIRARGLGLSDETDDARAFWVAVQRFLGP